MRYRLPVTLGSLLLLAAGLPAAEPPAPPYPPSTAIQSLIWHWNTYRTAAPGSDLWPVTWGPDDLLYAAWGDGGGFGGSDSDGRVSLGFARIENGPEDFHGVNINGGKNAEHPASFPKRGKTGGLLFIDHTLYAMVNLQDAPWPNVDHVLAWSTNSGATWTRADWVFPKGAGNFQPAKFLNFGPGYTGVPTGLSGFVYLYGPRQTAPKDEEWEILLARVPQDRIRVRSDYEFFAGAGADGTTTWTADPAKARPVFADTHGASAPAVCYVPALKRFLLASFHTGPGQLGVFEGPEPWGPWRTVLYVEDWGGMGTQGEGLTCDFPQKWMSADGLTLWNVFSVYGPGAKKGIKGHDRFNLVKVTVTPYAARSASGAGETSH